MRKTLLFWNIATMVIALLFFPQVGKSQYPYIKIADVVVNVGNQDNVTSDYISGTIRYDSATRTLILQDATIVAPPPSPDPYYQELVVFVAGQYKDFNIKLIGNNTKSKNIKATIRRELNSSPYTFKPTPGKEGYWELIEYQEEIFENEGIERMFNL